MTKENAKENARVTYEWDAFIATQPPFNNYGELSPAAQREACELAEKQGNRLAEQLRKSK